VDGFHGIYLRLLGCSGESDGGSPNLIGVKLEMANLKRRTVW
jgi:hypothetical protein